MRYANPDDLNYDQEVYESLDVLNKDLLIRFYNLFVDRIDDRESGFSEETKKTTDDLKKIIAADLQNESRVFFERYESLKDEGIRLLPVTKYLAENYDMPTEDLEFSSTHDLVITLYEYNLIDQIDSISEEVSLNQNAWRRSFVLEESLPLQGLAGDLEHFHKYWNQEKEGSVPVRVILESKGNNNATLHIYQEKQTGSNTYSTFNFRKTSSEEKEIPEVPEITITEVFRLKDIRFRIETINTGSRFVFTDGINNWSRTLNSLFKHLYDIDDFTDELSRETMDEVEEVESKFEIGIESDADPLETAQEAIDERRSDAKDEVEGIGLPPDETEKLKNIIDTIEIGGSDIEDDPSINTSSFRLVGELPEMFKAVDIESGFKDMLETADPDKRSFVIRVNSKAVALENGTWRKLDPGSLGDAERQALVTFFSGNSNG